MPYHTLPEGARHRDILIHSLIKEGYQFIEKYALPDDMGFIYVFHREEDGSTISVNLPEDDKPIGSTTWLNIISVSARIGVEILGDVLKNLLSFL